MPSRVPTRGTQIDTRDTLYNDGEYFGPMFHCVYLSKTRMTASAKAKLLLDDLIYQYRGKNNGKLVLCPREKDLNDGTSVLERTGLSEKSVYRAAAELEVLGLVVCTRRGNFARRVSYYAITWWPLNNTGIEYEIKAGPITPLHWWRRGSPDWYLNRLKDTSKTHRRMVETICGSQKDD